MLLLYALKQWHRTYMHMHSCKNAWKPALQLIALLMNKLVLIIVL